MRRSIYIPDHYVCIQGLICFVVDPMCVDVLEGKLTQPCFILVDFHVTESQTVLNVSKGEAKPTRADPLVNRVPEGKAKSLPGHGKEWIMMAGG